MTFGTSLVDIIDWTVIATELYLILVIQHMDGLGLFRNIILIFLWCRFFYILMWDYFFDSMIKGKK